MIRDIERAAKTLAALPRERVADLVRRAGRAEVAVHSGERVRVSRGSYSDPTAAAVINKLDPLRREADPVFQAVKSMAQHLRDMADLAILIENEMRFVLDAKDRAKESAIVHCGACGREVANTKSDRLRSGYCGACYQAWLRAGKPYRFAFERSVQDTMAEAPTRRLATAN